MIRTALILLAALSMLAAADAVDAQAQRSEIPNEALGPGGNATAAPRAFLDAKPVTARHAMVVTAQHLATEVGVEILKRGGNAVDAAVAIGYALAVVHPCCGNIGGGGFMTIHFANGKNVFLDFREKAPLKATQKMFRDAGDRVVEGRSTRTYLAVGVPGTVLGLDTALATYGTMKRRDVMAPAIALAKDGYVLAEGDARLLAFRSRQFAAQANVARIFLNHGEPYKAGEHLKQTELAHTLELVAEDGPDAFYKGPIAREVVAASDENGGLLTLQDFAEYNVRWERPVTCGYRSYTIVSAPPPSSGGTTLCEILEIVEPYPLSEWGYGATRTTHYLVEAERRAFADRNTYLGDPAFVDNPVERLISPAHAAKLRATIDPEAATPSSQIAGSLGPIEGQHTTHYSVVDAQGNAVATTYTINFFFGNGRIAGDTGFFLNNEMDDFTAKPGVPNGFGLVQGETNAVAPGKRPLSSMTPTIVLENGRLVLVTGSPGGSTIISTTLESILNVVDFGMNMQQAVNAPRVHHQWLPDVIMVEPDYLTPDTRDRLEKMGYRFRMRPGWGAVEAIRVNPDTHLLEGANDDRRSAGLAAGY